MKAYHFLKLDMRAGSGSEPPWSIGEIRQLGGSIIPCRFGYHSSPTLYQALTYAPGPVACLVEIGGDIKEHGNPLDKYASSSRKLIKAINIQNKILSFSADCAEHVLHLFENVYKDDKRPRLAIEAIRDFIIGKITSQQLNAAYAAVYAAANAAAYAADAAYAATYAAYAATYAAYAADAADAADAAADAADAAAANAANAEVEKQWQQERFEFYTKDLFDD